MLVVLVVSTYVVSIVILSEALKNAMLVLPGKPVLVRYLCSWPYILLLAPAVVLVRRQQRGQRQRGMTRRAGT